MQQLSVPKEHVAGFAHKLFPFQTGFLDLLFDIGPALRQLFFHGVDASMRKPIRRNSVAPRIVR